jgi:hypothetical protein
MSPTQMVLNVWELDYTRLWVYDWTWDIFKPRHGMEFEIGDRDRRHIFWLYRKLGRKPNWNLNYFELLGKTPTVNYPNDGYLYYSCVVRFAYSPHTSIVAVDWCQVWYSSNLTDSVLGPISSIWTTKWLRAPFLRDVISWTWFFWYPRSSRYCM